MVGVTLCWQVDLDLDLLLVLECLVVLEEGPFDPNAILLTRSLYLCTNSLVVESKGGSVLCCDVEGDLVLVPVLEVGEGLAPDEGLPLL